ncbi:hypothetical protein QQS21_009117 [Conoideocrella luteorostrata]|uniref:Uncharacterized protein n=1 Tax=Conoideocrella luteorostrata TaxID=1105319 RepID=A0AAJ0FVX7_9HYPO|nr:hypothetical protein QQS21_009117 [Conoideocrella luteorostrata]
MDPFSKLPPEIRLLILESQPDFAAALSLITPLIRASPIMMQQFQNYRWRISSAYGGIPFHAGLIRDAIAIITFPEAPEHLNEDDHYANVCYHLSLWGKQRFPDPTKPDTLDVDMIYKLEKLFKWLSRYIKDYISKAASEFLPRAYLRLPEWSICHRSPRQLKLQQEATYVNPDKLSAEQQHQIIKGFLRYELLCRVYGPFGNDTNSSGRIFDRSNYSVMDLRNTPDPDSTSNWVLNRHYLFCFWDWALLNRFEGTSITSPELQLLPCVREYIQTLYGAYISELLSLEVPSTAIASGDFRLDWENAPASHINNFPDYAVPFHDDDDEDDFYDPLSPHDFDPDMPPYGSDDDISLYSSDDGISLPSSDDDIPLPSSDDDIPLPSSYESKEVFWPHKESRSYWNKDVISLVASAGLNFLTTVLVKGMHYTQIRGLIYSFSRHKPEINATSINGSVCGPLSETREAVDYYANSFIRLHRQRLWHLFKGSSIIPRLPTEHEYCQVYGPGPHGGIVKWNLDADKSRYELICHGRGIWTSEEMSKLRSPFWERTIH